MALQASRSQARHAAELLPISALSPDGLLVRSDGAYVRALDVTPSNPLVLDEDGAERMTRGLAELLLRGAAGMSVQLYAQGDPGGLEVLLPRCREQTDAATAVLLGGPEGGGQGEALRELAAVHERS